MCFFVDVFVKNRNANVLREQVKASFKKHMDETDPEKVLQSYSSIFSAHSLP